MCPPTPPAPIGSREARGAARSNDPRPLGPCASAGRVQWLWASRHARERRLGGPATASALELVASIEPLLAIHHPDGRTLLGVPRGTSRWCPARVQSVDLLAESYTVRYEDDGGQYDGEYDGRLAPPDGISARAATGGAAVQPTPQQRSRSYGEMQPPALPCMPRAPPPSSVPPPGSFQADPGRKLAAVRVVGDSGEARSDFAGAPVVPGRRRMMAGGYYLTEQSSADGHPGACLA